ncbi:MAG: hypothetical protein HDR80_10530 [Bacteroides sp.]|nr:hypothetical protein [Bacteroides sp.]MBD5371552.1 hypothetical protein [Bacteroides sp.]
MELQHILVPIFLCCILPVAIVLIVVLGKTRTYRLQTEIILKAIESNRELDINRLAESLGRPPKTPRQILLGRLQKGCLFSLLGVLLIVCGLCSLGEYDFGDDSVLFPMMGGSVCLAIGVSRLATYFVSRKDTDAQYMPTPKQ